jgi:(1->4)-alpha-D-glucan 1-alpha-D-glucosylmutase
VACFPVYRTYIRPDCETVREEDRRRILAAVRIAKRRNPEMSASFFDFIASVLLLEDPEGLSDDARRERRQFVLKFQQVTGPVTAKGLEDTAFYRYYPLLSLNEVGGDPATPGTSVEHFHRRIQEQAASWPHTMLATGTHDTKRGEDVRARLNVLSEVPEEWDQARLRWHEMNASARTELDGAPVPDANEEELIYQTLVGTWSVSQPDEKSRAAYVERIVAYTDKALREAKRHTSWLNPYEEYDQAVAGFIRTILAKTNSAFWSDLDKFVSSIADAGFVNSLAQTLVKMCVPGVPDFYQGVEFWDFNLVDPDNRRPVEFAARDKGLTQLAARAKKGVEALAAELLAAWPDERIKMFVIWRALQLRKTRRELVSGSYEPLKTDGPRKGNVCAFARFEMGSWTVCIVPRLVCEAWRWRPSSEKTRRAATASWPRGAWWQETIVQFPAGAPQRFVHVLSGAQLETRKDGEGGLQLDAGDVLASFPVALLTGELK